MKTFIYASNICYLIHTFWHIKFDILGFGRILFGAIGSIVKG